jgi:hypothetical protein
VKSSASVVAVVSLLVAVGSPARADDTIPFVPRGTLIPVVLTKEIRVGGMGDAQERKIKLEAAQDVIINGYVIAKKGDTVDGHYVSTKNVTKSLLGGKVSEELSVDVDDVVNFCGDTLNLAFERTFRGGARMSVIGVNAHDAVFDKGTILLAKTDRVGSPSRRRAGSYPTKRRPIPATDAAGDRLSGCPRTG